MPLSATQHSRKDRKDMSDHPPISPMFSSQVSEPLAASRRAVAVAGLVFAIISVLAVPFFVLINAFFPHQGLPLGVAGVFVGIVSSIVGVILSSLGLRSPSGRGMAIVGLILSLVVLALLVLLILLFMLSSFVTPHGGSPHITPTVIPGYATP